MIDTERILKALEYVIAQNKELRAHLFFVTLHLKHVIERVDSQEIGIAINNSQLLNLEKILIPPEVARWSHWNNRIFTSPDVIEQVSEIESVADVVEQYRPEGLNL